MNSKGWLVCFSVLTASLLLGGCTRTYTWKEEVTPKSGEKLLVQRSQKYNSSGGEWDSSIDLWYNLVQARIRIDGVPVEWVGPPAVYPMIVERWEGKYVVVYTRGVCYSFPYENPRHYIPPYYIDAFIDGKWKDVDVFEVMAIWPRNLVSEWRNGGFLSGTEKTRSLRSEQSAQSSLKWTDTYDLKLDSGCKNDKAPINKSRDMP